MCVYIDIRNNPLTGMIAATHTGLSESFPLQVSKIIYVTFGALTSLSRSLLMLKSCSEADHLECEELGTSCEEEGMSVLQQTGIICMPCTKHRNV